MRMGLFSFLCLSCATFGAAREGQAGAAGRAAVDPDAVRRDLTALSFAAPPPPPSKAVNAYLTFYRLDLPCAEHRLGTFTSGDYTLAAHVFKAQNPRGTVIVLHGYCDHAGITVNVLRKALELQCNAAVFDMPGHGLSTGERAGIDSFAEYVAAFRDFLRICRQNLPPPFYVVAHSTGCSTVIDYLLACREPPVDDVVLIAPLVHSASWRMSKIGWTAVKPFAESVPRVFRRNSSDKEFLQFLRNDPLQPRLLPRSWFRALVRWNKRIAPLDPCPKQITIVQGTKDTTVSWRYNVKFLRRKFPTAKVTLIEKGGHQLINEAEPMLTQTLECVAAALGRD